MPRPRNVKKLLAGLKLSPSEAAEMRELLKVDPRAEKLEQRRAAILEQLKALEAEIAGLTGEGKPAKAKTARKPRKDVSKPIAASKPPKVAKGRKAKTEAPKTTSKASPAKLAALAKAREVRAANRKKAKA